MISPLPFLVYLVATLLPFLILGLVIERYTRVTWVPRSASETKLAITDDRGATSYQDAL